ncbi:MAG: metallophosphoesterase [Saprospirales bacterium]|nr:MAG: metallophosphoesterase [Saprospirales bacterium]
MNSFSESSNVLIVSDTHSYSELSFVNDLPEAPDEIWHAGDIGSMDVVDAYKKIAPFRVVYGNIDSALIRSEVPESLIFSICGLKVLMIHIGGKPPRYNRRAKQLIDEVKPDIFVCGHSHICRVERDQKNNLLFINPGAIGIYGFHQFRTCIFLKILNGKPSRLKVLEYPR